MTSQLKCKIFPNGSKAWYLTDKIHQEDESIIEYTSRPKHWILDGKLHREDGPAVERADGSKYWYLNGEKLDPEEAMKDPKLKEKYPALINSMIVYQVHNS